MEGINRAYINPHKLLKYFYDAFKMSQYQIQKLDNIWKIQQLQTNGVQQKTFAIHFELRAALPEESPL